MIVVFHENNKVVQIYDYSSNLEIDVTLDAIQETLVLLATKNTSQFLGWCHESLKENLNLTKWDSILKHQLVLVSFETSNHFYMTPDIGYVEDTPFINVSKNNAYPTWFMSSDVGAMHASVLLKFEYLLKYKLSFDLFLNMIAKVGMKQGLLCYSNPNLLINASKKQVISKRNITSTDFLWFVKSNYRYRWMLLYLLNLSIYKKRFLLFPFLRLLLKKVITNKISFEDIKLKKYKKFSTPSIDVLIPTLGREKYLKDVLLDLGKQTILPKKVIIIEQNPIENEASKLDFLEEPWPFEIDHTLIYQLGACNARNIGLSKVTSDWVFFADDDVRFNFQLIDDAFKYLKLYDINAITLSSLQKNEIESNNVVSQFSVFGTCSSIVKSTALIDVKFDRAYEFGYGEDADFGMQLRNTGTDILYVPFAPMLHLKAPIGGFRKIIIMEWEKEAVLPKPSPTVMVYKLKHATKEQLQSYKTTLFLKFYKNQPIINPLSYYKQFQKAWERSVYWATNLINKESNEI